ncbi:MAG: hypothetical protein OEZ54_06990 [Gemmatimonadota bacterium]|nr:hypothetical protein [Gemmatimonadota bacterium]
MVRSKERRGGEGVLTDWRTGDPEVTQSVTGGGATERGEAARMERPLADWRTGGLADWRTGGLAD